MVLTASVVYRHVFTHNSYGYSFSVRLLADCERLTTEAQHLVLPIQVRTHTLLTSIASTQLFSHWATGTGMMIEQEAG